MKTVKQYLRAELVGRFLFPEEADEILEKLTSQKENSMFERWDDDVSDYGEGVLATLMISAADHVVDWIDEKHPKHFARSLFMNMSGIYEQEGLNETAPKKTQP